MNYVVYTVLILIVVLMLLQAWAMMESTKRRAEAAAKLEGDPEWASGYFDDGGIQRHPLGFFYRPTDDED